jgi:polar amino acid transport system ATP-binding protein
MFSGRNVKKSFNGMEVLHGIDLDVEPGKITVLVGPNGGGKTTLLWALSLLDPPTGGSVEIDGVLYDFDRPHSPHLSQPRRQVAIDGVPLSLPLRQKVFKRKTGASEPQINKNQKISPPWPRVTMVFQQLFLWPHLTLRENIRLPLERNNVSDSERRIEEYIRLFRMAHFIDRYPNEASLGQKQRVALARALALEPSYLLLDEITSALDVEQIGVILSHLQELRARGVGILIVTHLLGFARSAADKIVFLDEGKILQTGGSEVLDAPVNERVKLFLSMYKSGSSSGNQLEAVADAVVAQIRNGSFPEGENAEFLNRFQIIDLLRERIDETDLPRLFGVIEGREGASAAFALSLLRKFSERQEVQARLRSRWKSANAFLRGYLLWRILDDPELPGDWHATLFDFVFKEWDTFRKEQLMFWGMRKNVLEGIKSRISNPSFPESKKWAYLCCLPELAEDQKAAEGMIRSELDSSDAFTREVSRRLLDRFFSKRAV